MRIKNLNSNPLPTKIFQWLIFKTSRRFSDPWGWKNRINDKKGKKNYKFYQTNAEPRDVKILNNIPLHLETM